MEQFDSSEEESRSQAGPISYTSCAAERPQRLNVHILLRAPQRALNELTPGNGLQRTQRFFS